MAYNSYAVHTIVMQDAKGERTSVPIYMRYDSGVATLSSIAAFIAGNVTELDAITDGQIVSSSLSLQFALPGGIKTAPVADCDVEETGLLTYITDSPTKRAFAEDIGAFAQSKFVAGKINLADTDVAAWTSRATSTGGTFEFRNADFLAALATVRSGVKTFRKHRRAAKRT